PRVERLRGTGKPRLNIIPLVPLLHHRAALDEQARQPDGLLQKTTPVAAEVQYEAGDILLLQPGEKPLHVPRGAARVPRAVILHVPVKIVQMDPADAERRLPGLVELDQFTLG